MSRLKQALAKALAKGAREDALNCYAGLQSLEPEEPAWCHRAGELYARIGQPTKAIDNWAQAAELYANQAQLVKAIAMCTMILRHDPTHTNAQSRLAELQAERGLGEPRPVERTENEGHSGNDPAR